MQSALDHTREAKARLETAKSLLTEQINAYPGPIAGCDAQFNHLLAERRRVTEALKALEAEVHIPTPRAP